MGYLDRELISNLIFEVDILNKNINRLNRQISEFGDAVTRLRNELDKRLMPANGED